MRKALNVRLRANLKAIDDRVRAHRERYVHRFELALEDAAEDLELQLEVAQILVRVVEDVVLLDDRFIVLEANLIGERTLDFGAGEEDEVLVALDERRRLDDLILDLE